MLPTGPMGQAEFRTALQRLGLTQDVAAALFEASRSTINRYANGAQIPPSVAYTLRLMIHFEVTPDELAPYCRSLP